MGYRTAVERALARMTERAVESRWSDALGAGESYELLDREGVLEETRAHYVDATPEQVFRAFCKLGGRSGVAGVELPLAHSRFSGSAGGRPGTAARSAQPGAAAAR